MLLAGDNFYHKTGNFRQKLFSVITFLGDLGVEASESGMDVVDAQALTFDCTCSYLFLFASIRVLGSGGRALIGLLLLLSSIPSILPSPFFLDCLRKFRKLFLW